MRRLLFACLFLAGTALAADLEPLVIRDFSAGLVTDKDATLLPDGAAQDLQNVDIDDGSIRKRKGTLAVNSSYIGEGLPVRFLHEYVSPTNSFWLLAVSSNSLYGSTDGGATFSLLTSTYGISSTSRFQASNAFGNAYFVDGSTNAIVFDGTSVTHNTSVPTGGVTAFWADRLWIANGSTLYASRVSDATDWTDDGVDDADAFTAVVRNNNGYTITALKPFGADLFVFKAKSIDRVVLASDGLNFGLYPITSHLGTTHPDSVVSADNAIVWLAEDGYYAYDGSQIRRISENISPTVEGITQLDSLSRLYAETDMTAGTDDNTTAELVSGQVVLRQGPFSEGPAFAGSTSNAYVSGGQICISTGNTSVSGSGFTDAALSPWTLEAGGATWGRQGTFYYDGDGYAAYASYAATTRWWGSGGSGVIYYAIRNSAGSVLASGTLSAGNSSWAAKTIPMSSFAGKYVRIVIGDNAGTNLVSELFFSNGVDVVFYAYGQLRSGPAYWNLVDFVAGGKCANTSGYYLSATHDTAISSPTWNASQATWTANGQSVVVYSRTSATDPPNTDVLWSTGSAISSPSARYLRYRVVLTLQDGGAGLPLFTGATINYKAPSGRYLSPGIDLAGATAWLPFSAVGSADSGGLTYELYTDTDTSITPGTASTFISSQTLTSGQTPTLTLNNYAFLAATMTTTGVPDPYVQEWQLQWGEGSVSNIVSSEFFDQKYYSAVSLGGVKNDTVLVYDKNGAWTKYTGLEPYYMKKYRTQLYYGDASTGTVVRMNADRYRDYDNATIDAYWTSKDFDLGAPLTTKSLIRYYLTADRAEDSNITFEYGVERGALTGTQYALDQNAGFFRQVIKPSSTVYSEGIQHRFKISDDTLDGDMSVLSVTGQWRKNTNP